MNKYKVISEVLNVIGGTIGLTDLQYKPRCRKLKRLDKNKYEVLLPIQFKNGEIIEYDGDLPRNMEDSLEYIRSKAEIQAEKEAEAAKAKEAEEAAKAKENT